MLSHNDNEVSLSPTPIRLYHQNGLEMVLNGMTSSNVRIDLIVDGQKNTVKVE